MRPDREFLFFKVGRNTSWQKRRLAEPTTPSGTPPPSPLHATHAGYKRNRENKSTASGGCRGGSPLATRSPFRSCALSKALGESRHAVRCKRHDSAGASAQAPPHHWRLLLWDGAKNTPSHFHAGAAKLTLSIKERGESVTALYRSVPPVQQ